MNPREAFGDYEKENDAALAKSLLIYREPLFFTSKILPLKVGKMKTVSHMTNMPSLLREHFRYLCYNGYNLIIKD